MIYQNTVDLTAVLRRLSERGMRITPALMATLSPYPTSHIKRFGDFVVDLSIPPLPVDEGAHLLHDLSRE